MRFEHPHLLWLLLLAVPALSAFLWWAWRTKRRLIAQFVQSRLLANLTVGVSARRQRTRMVLLVVSIALLIVVLARPQWGFGWEEAKQRGLDIIVAIDTSRSMLAEDVTPNRLARARLAALDLKKLARTDRVGLVAFAGTAFLQCPLSFDEEAFRQSLNALDVNIIPQGGSAIAEAIQTAQIAFKEKNDNHKVLVLFTDGEDHDGNAVDAAKSATKAGLRIFTVGVGTPNGELLRITDGKGRSDFIRDEQGNVVKSRLNEQLLRQIAQSADGFYMLLTGANTIELLYERGLAPLPKTELSSRRIKRFHERYQWLLSLTIVLLLVEMFLPERRRVVRSEVVTPASARPELRNAAALILFLLVPVSAWASTSGALKNYGAGRYDVSLQEYERLLKEKPDDARLHFNAGAASFQNKDYEKALKHLNSSLLTEDLQLQQRAYYNLGNTQYRLGEAAHDPTKMQQDWEQAISSYESALALNHQDEDAKFNLELVKKKLEELKKQQQQQQQSKDDKKDDKKEDSKQDQQSKDDQKKEQQKSESNQEQKPNQDQQQQEQQQSKKDESQPQDQKQSDKKEGEQGEKKDQQEQSEDQKGNASRPRAIQMTPQEAQRLLDALKSDEKAMIFVPPRTNRANRVFKDW
jgi:Ca-activated chloride channel family protein